MNWWLLLLLALSACRGIHEEVVAERMLGRKLVQHPFAMTLEKIDELLMRLKTDTSGLECELCVVGSQPAGEHRQVYCAISGIHTGCFLANEVAPGWVQIIAIERPLPMQLARAIWRYLEGPDGTDFGITDETISSLTTQQENEFSGAWSFFGNAGMSAVISQSNPATIPANIAGEFREAVGVNTNLLVLSGLVLFVLTFAVNFAARAVLARRAEFDGAAG